MEPEKALLRFAWKMTKALPEMAEAVVEQLRDLGWDDEAIYYTILVVSLFNFYNRWVTTSAVHPVSEEIHRLYGKRLAQSGYEPKRRLAGMRS
jgi:hypothetical protein